MIALPGLHPAYEQHIPTIAVYQKSKGEMDVYGMLFETKISSYW